MGVQQGRKGIRHGPALDPSDFGGAARVFRKQAPFPGQFQSGLVPGTLRQRIGQRRGADSLRL